jgi:long-chain acyl-CoA synthetase
LHDSGAKLVFISNDTQAAKLAAVWDQVQSQKIRVISFDPCQVTVGDRRIETIADFVGPLDDPGPPVLENAAKALTGQSLATILYTSGTTGEPKGVVLSQANLVSNATGTAAALPQFADDTRLCFLPLSHIFARTCDLYTWIVCGGLLALAESRDTVLADCDALHPTLLNGVPYFYQRIQRYLVEQGLAGKPEHLKRLLGGRIRACCSGGAALPDYLFDFFVERGVPLLQGYGLTESSPVITVSSLEHHRRGTVGRCIPEVEVRISSDGEILTRGPHVMVGFWRNDEATREVVRDGWLHTGDLGELDSDGFLRITGRKKEIIVTAAGKNIVPAYIESLLCNDPLIDQAFVVGDDRNYLGALIVANQDQINAAVRTAGVDRNRRDVKRELIGESISRQLANVSYHEQVRTFTLLPRAFSIDQGEMTPKLSLRRGVIAEHFAAEIESLYGE